MSTRDWSVTKPQPRRIFKCIPSRYALMVTSALVTLCSLTSLVMGFMLYRKLGASAPSTNPSPSNMFTGNHRNSLFNIAIMIHLLVYAFLVIIGAVGLYAVLSRKSRIASHFCSAILGEIIFGVITGSACLYVLFHHSTRSVLQMQSCINATMEGAGRITNVFVESFCYRRPLAKGVVLSVVVFGWALQGGESLFPDPWTRPDKFRSGIPCWQLVHWPADRRGRVRRTEAHRRRRGDLVNHLDSSRKFNKSVLGVLFGRARSPISYWILRHYWTRVVTG